MSMRRPKKHPCGRRKLAPSYIGPPNSLEELEVFVEESVRSILQADGADAGVYLNRGYTLFTFQEPIQRWLEQLRAGRAPEEPLRQWRLLKTLLRRHLRCHWDNSPRWNGAVSYSHPGAIAPSTEFSRLICDLAEQDERVSGLNGDLP